MKILDIHDERDYSLITVEMQPDEKDFFAGVGMRLGFATMALNITIEEALNIIEREVSDKAFDEEMERVYDQRRETYEEDIRRSYRELGL